MEFMILDSTFHAIQVIDSYMSAIWTVRFQECGDFELYASVRSDFLESFQIGNYLWRKDSDRVMIIETVEIETDADDVPNLIIKGRSLESILDRRIIMDPVTYEDKAVNAVVADLLNKSIINPTKSSRKIDGFNYVETTDSRITSQTITTTLRGENLYEAIVAICQSCKIGFRVLPNYDNDSAGFDFELYMGVDRSYDQNEVPYVVFSPAFENLSGSKYLQSYEAYKNSVYSIGTYQKETINRVKDDDGNYVEETEYVETEVTIWKESESSEPTGLNRREVFIDNGSLSEGEQGGEESTWLEVASQKGLEELSQYKTTAAFDGELESTRQFVLGRDFDIGDIVQVENEYGIGGSVYVSEIVMSFDTTGLTITPTFTNTEETEN